MNKQQHASIWSRLLSLSNDSTAKIIIVAVAICLICSIMVASAAVLLRPIQKQNEMLARQKEILKVAGLYQVDKDIASTYKLIETHYVDLRSGEFVAINKKNKQNPLTIPDDKNITGISEIMQYQPVYLVRIDEKLQTIVLPLLGKGLWSTIHGFVALSADANTVKAITFYDHAETPGLGGEISNPVWLAKWKGKHIYNKQGDAFIRVIKGKVSSSSNNALHEIDGLSGATLTANGITNIMHFWLGETGFSPLLARLRKNNTQENH